MKPSLELGAFRKSGAPAGYFLSHGKKQHAGQWMNRSLELGAFRQSGAPAGCFLSHITIEGCSDASWFVLELVHALSENLDTRSTCVDGVWRIRTANIPDRVLRIFGGSSALLALLAKYSVVDRDGCSFGIDTKSNALENLKSNASATGTRSGSCKPARPASSTGLDRCPSCKMCRASR